MKKPGVSKRPKRPKPSKLENHGVAGVAVGMRPSLPTKMVPEGLCPCGTEKCKHFCPNLPISKDPVNLITSKKRGRKRERFSLPYVESVESTSLKPQKACSPTQKCSKREGKQRCEYHRYDGFSNAVTSRKGTSPTSTKTNGVYKKKSIRPSINYDTKNKRCLFCKVICGIQSKIRSLSALERHSLVSVKVCGAPDSDSNWFVKLSCALNHKFWISIRSFYSPNRWCDRCPQLGATPASLLDPIKCSPPQIKSKKTFEVRSPSSLKTYQKFLFESAAKKMAIHPQPASPLRKCKEKRHRQDKELKAAKDECKSLVAVGIKVSVSQCVAIKRVFEAATKMLHDVYSVVEVLFQEKQTSPDTIRKAYLSLIRKIHPDKCHHPQASEASKQLHQLYRQILEKLGQH
eukprot:Platyproteum_vivax@DN3356_c0_g1_i1.p1